MTAKINFKMVRKESIDQAIREYLKQNDMSSIDAIKCLVQSFSFILADQNIQLKELISKSEKLNINYQMAHSLDLAWTIQEKLFINKKTS